MAETTEFNSSRENLITRIRKRDGRVVDFGKSKISNAIYKALVATGKPDYRLTETLSDKVMQKMVQHGYASTEVSAIPSVEDVQDIVESILIEEGLSDTAKSYILYRHERRKIRDEKMKILNKKDLDEVDKAFDVNSLQVLAARNHLKNKKNEMAKGQKKRFEEVVILLAIPVIFHDSGLLDLEGSNTGEIEEVEKFYSK